jgi:hypothetical protein
MGDLAKQKGLLVCTRWCYDNLEVERRPFEIEATFAAGVDQEGADLRVIDRGFFEGFDETNR